MPRLFLSAGDTSGDQHAARLVHHLGGMLDDLSVEGLGGPELAAAGCEVHEDLVRHSIFGFAGAIRALPEMFGVLRRTAGMFDARRPDAVVLVDYPGLNLFVARLAHRRGIPVIYFVAPQLWAWAPWRVARFARSVDEALVIFPFEVPFFREAGIDATYIGHPLLDSLPAEAPDEQGIADKPRPVALLPGSRPREVAKHMPLLLETARRLLVSHPDASFHSAHVSAAGREQMAAAAESAGVPLSLHDDRVHAVMAGCRCAIVASGTATLETALFGTPQVVFYRSPRFEALVARWLVIPDDVGQVNLVAGRRVAPELLMVESDPAALAAAVLPLMTEGPEWLAQREAMAGLRERMAAPLQGQSAVRRAAEHIARRLSESRPTG
jgi:lipid-A-disaccharide synthase